MITNLKSARASTEAIERLYITMRHLFYRGAYKVSGSSGLSLRELLFKINPEIYGSMADDNQVELQGLLYVLDRLPEGIEQTAYINLSADEGYNSSLFSPIVPLKRRRNCYRIDKDQMNIEVTRGRSEIYDILTHLTFFYNEADKVMRRAFENDPKNMSRVWGKIKDVVQKTEPLSRKEREVALIHLANILGRTFQETQLAHKAFATDKNKDRLFHIVYWMGKLSYQDIYERKRREISFTSTLRAQIGHHITGEKWANQIKNELFKHDLHEKNLHIISSNMHSVMNVIFAHNALGKKYEAKEELKLYQKLSTEKNKELRDKVKSFALDSGMIYIKDYTGANIDVQLIDLCDINWNNTALPSFSVCKNDVLIVMDYAFGEQAFELMDELLKPYKEKGGFKMNVKSVSIMGKAGILNGKKGDIMVPNAHVFEGTADNYPFNNQLDISDFKGNRLGVYEGLMVTVLGTSLQNKELLHFFRDTSWNGIGLEMEGAHYQKAIQIASKIRGHIYEDVKVSYAYYASDNPLETGGTLASGGLGMTGVKPTYLITQKIMEKIHAV